MNLANEKNAIKDKGVTKTIKEIEDRAKLLPGTIPSIKLMITDFIREQLLKGHTKVSVADISKALEFRIKKEKLENKYKLDTFKNSIRGELNHHEQNSKSKNGLKLFKRIERGYYKLTENGKNYKGR